MFRAEGTAGAKVWRLAEVRGTERKPGGWQENGSHILEGLGALEGSQDYLSVATAIGRFKQLGDRVWFVFSKDHSSCCATDRSGERGGGGPVGGWVAGQGRGEEDTEDPAAHTCSACPLGRVQSHFSDSISLDPSGSPRGGQGRWRPYITMSNGGLGSDAPQGPPAGHGEQRLEPRYLSLS